MQENNLSQGPFYKVMLIRTKYSYVADERFMMWYGSDTPCGRKQIEETVAVEVSFTLYSHADGVEETMRTELSIRTEILYSMRTGAKSQNATGNLKGYKRG